MLINTLKRLISTSRQIAVSQRLTVSDLQTISYIYGNPENRKNRFFGVPGREKKMSFTATMSAAEKFQTQNVVDSFNKTLTANGRKTSNELGKDDFLKILIAQLSNQDPTSPLENTEFIAQMAQFSSLEQMTNMSQNFEKLAGMINSSEAQSLLGKTVELDAGDTSVTGQVQAATRGVQPQVFVNGMYYSMDKVKAVYGI